MSILSLTAVELGRKIKAKEVSVSEAVEAVLAQIETYDKEYNCYISVDREGARTRARQSKITFVQKGCLPPVVQKFLKALCRHTAHRRF